MNETASIKQKAALASIAASALLTLGKLVAGLMSGSLALLSEAGHGLLDTGATILTWYAVRVADKPADDEHHYGHGKVEAVAALVETGLLIVLACGVAWEAVRRLTGADTADVDASWLAFAVLGISIVVDAVRWRSLAKIARETKSDALAADALHFSSDLVASICVALGLIATKYGYPQGDALAAIGVSLFIAIAGYRLGRRTVDTLVDAAPKGLADDMREIIAAVPGVIGVETVRLRPAGATVFGEVSIAAPRTQPAERIVAVREAVAAAIAEKFPEAVVTVRATPRAIDDETVLERVLLIAGLRHLAVHHVTVQQIDGRHSVSLDLELDGNMPHGLAHETADALEKAIEAELGPGVEVETHIEPLEVRELDGHPADAQETGKIAAVLQTRAAEGGVISDVHDVRVRQTPTGQVVNYHCRVDPALSVRRVHDAVDHLDQGVRAQFSAVVRVVGHAEPTPAGPKASA